MRMWGFSFESRHSIVVFMCLATTILTEALARLSTQHATAINIFSSVKKENSNVLVELGFCQMFHSDAYTHSISKCSNLLSSKTVFVGFFCFQIERILYFSNDLVNLFGEYMQISVGKILYK